MDAKLARYLSDIASVRQHIANNIMNASRSIVDQKTVHRMNAEASRLDRLFIDVMLTGIIPGEVVEEVDSMPDVDINERIAQVKVHMAVPAIPIPPEPLVAKETKRLVKKKRHVPEKLERPADEEEVFKQLLAEAENEVAQAQKTAKKSKKKVLKK